MKEPPSYCSGRSRLSAASFDSLHAQLLNDEISFYVADQTLGIESERCDVQPLLDEEVAFVTKPDHVLANRKRVSPSDLVKYPFIGVADKIPAILRRWFLSGLTTDRDQELLQRNYPFVVCDHYEALRVLLLSTDYVTGGPIDLVQKDIDGAIVCRLNLSKLDIVISSGLVTRNDRTLSPAALALKKCFEHEYENR